MNFHVIKENDLFYLSDPDGNVPEFSAGYDGYGLYTNDTRVLSRLDWRTSPVVLVPLDADDSNNFQATYRYTNQELRSGDSVEIIRESLLVTRNQFVDGRRFYEEVEVQNYADQKVQFQISYIVNADFKDMFEVRGFTGRAWSGDRKVEVANEKALYTYRATDGLRLATTVSMTGAEHMTASIVSQNQDVELKGSVTVPPKETVRCGIIIECNVVEEECDTPISSHHNENRNVFDEASRERSRIRESYETWLNAAPNVSGDEGFSKWYQRGLRDIRMLLTDIGHGPFPVAGVPWYAVPFGRDSIITALQLLSVDPKVAKGTLLTMASFQGKAVDASRDEQPGKILHEWRVGELTRTGQMPFGPYYGTIDATPLFLILAAEYCLWTGDTELIQSLDDVIRRAFAWIEQYGDRDGDGFVEYYQEASGGIANQGWKDSRDSIVHKDGTLAEAPIALCEVQGYVYKAYQLWSTLYTRLGHSADAERCRTKAEELQQRFIERFWMEEEDAVALALDKHKNKVASISSNMGQVLWSGILPDDYAVRLANRLLAPDMFSGYGIRTLSALEKAYNPLSYHNGTVWPHDNSLIISGFQKYGLQEAVAETITGLMRAASHFPLSRLPELFAGYGTGEVSAPVPYPVSCSPQAWAAATPMLALQAMMGLVPDTLAGVIHLNPVLPNNVNELHISGIRVGQGVLDISLLRSKYGETSVLIRRNTTGMAIHLGTGSGGEARTTSNG